MGMRFLPIIQSFLVQTRFFFIQLHSGDQELSIEYHYDYFWTKIKNTKFSGMGVACSLFGAEV